jgi:hypothetical protein
MFGIRSHVADEPNLLERAFAAGCTRLAVISLHPGAGARTVLERAASEFHKRGISLGLTRAPRLPLEALDPGAVMPIRVPEGTIVATTPVPEQEGFLEPLGSAFGRSSLGELQLFRARQSAYLRLYGPDDDDSMRQALERLDEMSGGLALVDGAWERRGFAAPGGAQAVVLVAGAGFSGRPERSAAALRHVVEILRLERADRSALEAWPRVDEQGIPAVLDAGSQDLTFAESCGEELVTDLVSMNGQGLVVLLPQGLHNDLLGPLSRSPLRCTLVVRDPTCFRAAPIYYRSWIRGGGTIRVTEAMRVLAVATNPVNCSGPDAHPERFRKLVSDTLSNLPIHDVVLETERLINPSIWELLRRPVVLSQLFKR